MPMPQHCIDCDKVATVLEDSVPYCSGCYMKEFRLEKTKAKTSKRSSSRYSSR